MRPCGIGQVVTGKEEKLTEVPQLSAHGDQLTRTPITAAPGYFSAATSTKISSLSRFIK